MPLTDYLVHWYEQDATSFLEGAEIVLEYFVEPNGSVGDGTVRRIVLALLGLAQIHRGRAGGDPVTSTGASFSDLARFLLGASHFPEALAAANAALYLFGGEPARPEFLTAAELGFAAARGTGQEEAMRTAQASVAAGLAVAARDPRGARRAFDAVELALRLLPEGDGRLGAMALLNQVTDPKSPNHKLGRYLFLATAQAGVGSFDAVAIRSIVRLDCDMDFDTWKSLLGELMPALTDIETARFALLPPGEADRAVAEWETFSFAHASFRAAIPLHNSILQEHNLDELLFVLHHEITHVYSMRSGVGLAVVALRVAILELERRLWSFVPGLVREARTEHLLEHGTAPLERHEILALAQAEQSLALTRKLQILQDPWQPWFEGIAVFAELADDPTMDPDASSDAMTALVNLFDPDDIVSQTLDLKEVMARRDAAERLYSEALNRSARYRLWTYLLDHHRHYLPGYFAVRRIIANWRGRMGEPLSGSSATRILLYLTRYGTWQVVPDLALSVDAFREEAARNLGAWLSSIDALEASHLAHILAGFPGSGGPTLLRWQDGRIEPLTGTVGELGAEENKEGMKLVLQALRTLTGDYADPGRVEGASDTCLYILDAVASGLRDVPYDEEGLGQILGGYRRALNVLVLAEVECPFWVNTRSQNLALLVRVRTKDVSDGKPRHKLVFLPLSQEEATALAAEIPRNRSARMRLARVVDLVSSAHYEGRAGSALPCRAVRHVELHSLGWVALGGAGARHPCRRHCLRAGRQSGDPA